MTRTAALAIALALAGCVSFPVTKIAVHEVDPWSVQVFCTAAARPRTISPGLVPADRHAPPMNEFPIDGCFRVDGDECVIYVLTRDEWIKRGDPDGYQRTIDHERRHCAEGYWHDDNGVENGARR